MIDIINTLQLKRGKVLYALNNSMNKQIKSNSFYEYEHGVCDTCHQFLTDCVCDDIRALDNGGFEQNEFEFCEECYQPINDCVCHLYTDLDIDYNVPITKYIKTSKKSTKYKRSQYLRYYDAYIPSYPFIKNDFEYESYADLQKRVPVDNYTIEYKNTGSDITIIAPHGGTIEPGTTEVAKIIAQNSSYNYYSFIGINRKETDLHITSHKFDEPLCIDLVKRSKIVVAIHGYQDVKKQICLGGRDNRLKNKAFNKLSAAGFTSITEGHMYPGIHPTNICNLGKRKRGLQLELSNGIRKDPNEIKKVADVINTLLQYV